MVTPPSRPPALLVGRTTPGRTADRRPGAGRISSCTCDPGTRGRAGAQADADGLDGRNRHQRLGEPAVELAVPLHVAARARPARRGRSPRTRRRACRPPRGRDRSRRSCRARRRDRRSAGASPAGSAAACSKVTVEGVRRDRCRRSRTTWLVDADAEAREELPRDGARRDARRGFARARAFEDVADVVAIVLQGARQIGVARAGTRHRRPRPGHAACGRRRPRRASCPASSPSPCSGSAARSARRSSRRARTPDSTSARSDSIAIRRPRPYPPCRRRRSSVIASRSTARPAGIPSSMTTSARPCDSPAVRKRSITGSFYTKFLRSFEREHPACVARLSRAGHLHRFRRPAADLRAGSTAIPPGSTGRRSPISRTPAWGRCRTDRRAHDGAGGRRSGWRGRSATGPRD